VAVLTTLAFVVRYRSKQTKLEIAKSPNKPNIFKRVELAAHSLFNSRFHDSNPGITKNSKCNLLNESKGKVVCFFKLMTCSF
jgi:hypothetical protein